MNVANKHVVPVVLCFLPNLLAKKIVTDLRLASHTEITDPCLPTLVAVVDPRGCTVGIARDIASFSLIRFFDHLFESSFSLPFLDLKFFFSCHVLLIHLASLFGCSVHLLALDRPMRDTEAVHFGQRRRARCVLDAHAS